MIIEKYFNLKHWKKTPIHWKIFFLNQTIKKLNNLIHAPIKDLAYPDREEWIHSNEYINGFKKETVHRLWFSPELIDKIEQKKFGWQNDIDELQKELQKELDTFLKEKKD